MTRLEIIYIFVKLLLALTPWLYVISHLTSFEQELSVLKGIMYSTAGDTRKREREDAGGLAEPKRLTTRFSVSLLLPIDAVGLIIGKVPMVYYPAV